MEFGFFKSDSRNRRRFLTTFTRLVNKILKDIYYPRSDSNLPLFIFVDNMCRTLDFVTNGKEVLVGSVKTWKYSLPKSALDTNQEKNKGFCVGEPRQCLPTGTLSLTTCLKETVGLELPMVMSKPHFLDADKSLRRHFTGLNPNPNHHQTELYVEPLTGLMLKEIFIT